MARFRTLPWQERLAKKGQKALLREIQRQEAALREIVTQAARDAEAIVSKISGPQVGQVVRRAQYIQHQAELFRLSSQMWGENIPDSVVRGIKRATDAAVRSQQQLLSVLTRAVPKDAQALASSFERAATIGFENIQSRLLNDIQLSPNVFRNKAFMDGKIDQIINDGISLGQSAKEISDAVVGHINPRVMGGQRYAAMRLGRTELNNSFHTTSVRSYAQSPYVKGVQWTVSGSHQQDDDCDEISDDDSFDLGAGVYPPGEVPFKPHPQCFCYLVPITISNTEFVNMIVARESALT